MASPSTDPSERLTLTIPSSLKKRVEAAVPDRQRSAFAAKVLEEALKAKARKEALDMLDSLPVSPASSESSVEVQRRYREQFDKAQADV